MMSMSEKVSYQLLEVQGLALKVIANPIVYWTKSEAERNVDQLLIATNRARIIRNMDLFLAGHLN